MRILDWIGVWSNSLKVIKLLNSWQIEKDDNIIRWDGFKLHNMVGDKYKNCRIGRIAWIKRCFLYTCIFSPSTTILCSLKPTLLFGSFVQTMLKLYCVHLITVKNYPARKQEILSQQNRYICHQYCIWNINGTPSFL